MESAPDPKTLFLAVRGIDGLAARTFVQNRDDGEGRVCLLDASLEMS
jgi:hypothetical protein